MTSVGRDGASDAVAFIRAGTPAVEFGPVGAGHHGPEEWVSVASLAAYRQTLCDFARTAPVDRSAAGRMRRMSDESARERDDEAGRARPRSRRRRASD